MPSPALFIPEIPVVGPNHLILAFARDVHRPERLVAVGGQRVDVALLSEDGGRQWQALPSPGKGLRGAHLDGNTLWVCGEYGFLAVSRDGGATFTTIPTETSGCLFGVAVDAQGVVWCCGDGGFVIASVDDGVSWKRLHAKVSLSRAHRSPHGVLVPTDAPGDLLVLTSPKQKPTMKRVRIGAGGDLMTATTTPRGTVIVVGAGGACFRSVDGAQTFTKVESGTRQLLCGVCASADGRVFAVGGAGTVLVSEDDGVTFAPATTGLTGVLWSCVAVGDDVFVGGEGGLIARLMPLAQARAATPPVVRRDLVPGVIVDDTLRAMVRPWRGASPDLFVAPPSLPSTDEAWPPVRALFWASDRYRTALTAKDSGIWALAIGPTARSRALADRLLDARFRPIDDDAALALAKAAFLDVFQGPLSERLADAVADLLVASVGVEGAVVAALRGLPQELPYTGVGLFGRLRDRAVLASDADYAALLQRVPVVVHEEIARDPKNTRRMVHLLGAASFLLPPGEREHDVERALLDRAAARIGRFGDLDIAHASLLASGDPGVLARFFARNREKRHEFFAGGARPYLATMLVRGVALLRERLPDLRPNYDIAVDVWATLLARVDGERSIQGLFAQRRTKPARAIDAALAWRASLDPAAMRHLLVAEASRLDDDDVAGRAALEGLLAPRTMPSHLGHDVLVRRLGEPSPWVPPSPLPAPTLAVPPAFALPPTIALTDKERAAAARNQPSDGHWTWQADDAAPSAADDDDDADDSAGPRDLVRTLKGPAADAYVAFRERWRLPTSTALYVLLPPRLHERLVALGASSGDGRWNYWHGALIKGGDVVLPGLRAMVHGNADLEARLATLLPVGDVACIGPVVEAFVGRKHKALARQWILRHRPHAIAGALTLLVVDDVAPALKDGAARVLRFLDGLGARDAILARARAHDADLAARVTAILDEDPLLQPGAKVPTLPAYAQPAVLPKLMSTDGRVLADDEVTALLVRLAWSNADELHPALQQAKRTLTATSLAALARGLFEAWLREGADPKQGWCMLAVGVFGDDALVRELAALVRAWPGESAAARAQQGLDVLVVHGGDVALLQVSLIAEKSKFAGLKKGAIERIAAIAERRGLTRDELADRLVPTFGLDDDAGCVLDFGARRFTLTFDEQLVPRVKDDGGAVLKDLPKPGKSDDAALAKAAKARLTGLKKDVKTVADVLLRRLERAMLEGRAFDVDVFTTCFVQHPLAFHVARRLVWEACDADGHRLGLFRIAEDRTFADVDDSLWTLPRGARVRVVHPLDVDEATLARWGGLFGDYALLQPFAQLGRPRHRVVDDERAQTTLMRFAGRALPAPKLVFGLEGRGWRREGAGDGGGFSSHDRELAGVRATVHYEGAVAMGFIEEGELLTLGEVTFTTTRPLTLGERTIAPRTALTLGEVPPALFSEVVADLEGVLG